MATLDLKSSSYMGYGAMGYLQLGMGNDQLGEIFLSADFVPGNFRVRRGAEGPQCVISWDAPTGLDDVTLFPDSEYTVRLERRTLDWSYRLGEGTVVYEGTRTTGHALADICPDATRNRLDGVVALTSYYYTLYVYEASTGLYVTDPRLQRNEFTIDTGYFNRKLYDTLPRVYRVRDSVDEAYGGTKQLVLAESTGTGDLAGERFNFKESTSAKYGQLYRFLKLVGLQLDEIRGLLDYARRCNDLDVCDVRWLHRLASNVGLSLIRGLRVERQRADLRQIVHFYKTKGTAGAAESRTAAISGSNDVVVSEYHDNTFMFSDPESTFQNVFNIENRVDPELFAFTGGLTILTNQLAWTTPIPRYSFIPGDVVTITSGSVGVVLGTYPVLAHSQITNVMTILGGMGAGLTDVVGSISRKMDPRYTHLPFGGGLYFYSGDTNAGPSVKFVEAHTALTFGFSPYKPYNVMELNAQFTVEFNIKPLEWPNDPATVGTITSAFVVDRFYDEGGTRKSTFLFKLNSAKLAGSGLVTHRLAVYYNVAGTDVFVGQIKEESGLLQLGKRLHIAVTRETVDTNSPVGTVWKIYANGVLTFTSSTINYAVPGALPDPLDGGIRFGHATTLNGAAFVLDEVRVWSSVRTAAQIAEFMDRPINGKNGELLLYCPCDALIQNVLLDTSSITNHGTRATTAGRLPDVVGSLLPDPAASFGWNKTYHQKELLGDDGRYVCGKTYGIKSAAVFVSQNNLSNSPVVTTI